MAPPAMRRRARKGSPPASTPPCGPAREDTGHLQPRGRLSRRHDRRSRDEGRERALSYVHLARRIPPVAARRQCRSAADRAGHRSWLRRGASARRHFAAKGKRCSSARALLESLSLTPNEAARHGLKINLDGMRRTAFDLLALPDVSIESLRGDLAGASRNRAKNRRANRNRRQICRLSRSPEQRHRSLPPRRGAGDPRELSIMRPYPASPTKYARGSKKSGRAPWGRPADRGHDARRHDTFGRESFATPADRHLDVLRQKPCRIRAAHPLLAVCRRRFCGASKIYATAPRKMAERGQFRRQIDPGRSLGPAFRRFASSLAEAVPEARRWLDLGSGAGFPGLVTAINYAGEPGARVHLIESDQRKCAFLQTVARETAAPAIVHCGRIETILPALRRADRCDQRPRPGAAWRPHPPYGKIP